MEYTDYRSDCENLSDGLCFSDFHTALLRVLMEAQTPLTVGLLGPWESGKTILLQNLQKEIGKKDQMDSEGRHSVLTVWFTTWKHECYEFLGQAFMLQILDTLRSRKTSVGSQGSPRGVSVPVTPDEELKEQLDYLNQLIQNPLEPEQLTLTEQTVTAFQEALKLRLRKDGRLIVLVDGLDQCLPDRAVEVLEKVNLLQEVPGMVFVLGMDQENMVSHETKEPDREGLSAQRVQNLLRVVQLYFHLPPLAAEDIEMYLLVLEEGVQTADRLDRVTRSVFAHGLYPTPQRVKQALGTFNFLRTVILELEKRPESEGGLQPESIAWPLLAKTVLIQTQWPELYQEWRQYPTLVHTLEEEYAQRSAKGGGALRGQHSVVQSPTTEGDRMLSSVLLNPYLTEQRRYALLRRMLTFSPSKEVGKRREKTCFEGLSWEQMAAYTRLPGTVEAPGLTTDPPYELLSEMISGDRARIQDAVEWLKEKEKKLEWKGLLRGVQEQLVQLMRNPDRPARERASAGNALALLGDPRFRPEVWYLPGEPLLGFVGIPRGEFCMGTCKEAPIPSCLSGGGRQWLQWETPGGLRVGPWPYYIARYPVTVAQFRAFVEASGHRPADENCLLGLDNHPVVCVTWHEALAYCQWLTEQLKESQVTPEELAVALWAESWVVTLPSEAEWEKAGRGGARILGLEKDTHETSMVDNPNENRLYPWGDIPTPIRANYSDTGLYTTSTVGCFPSGASPYGVEDLSGNVWEWTRSLWGPAGDEPGFGYPYVSTDGREDLNDRGFRVVRGGTYELGAGFVRCATRFRAHPDSCDDDLGFRVVVSRLYS